MAKVHYTALRLWAMLKKEFIQIRRDYITYLSLMIIPFIQLIMFGYIINTDAHHLPSVILSYDSSPFTNDLIQALRQTKYFDIISIEDNKNVTDNMLLMGKVQFVINIPHSFTRDLIRKRQPHILIEADGTDPVAVSHPLNAASQLVNIVFIAVQKSMVLVYACHL